MPWYNGRLLEVGGLSPLTEHSFSWKINLEKAKGMSKPKYRKFLNSQKCSFEIPTKLGFSVSFSMWFETQRGMQKLKVCGVIDKESVLKFPTTANFFYNFGTRAKSSLLLIQYSSLSRIGDELDLAYLNWLWVNDTVVISGKVKLYAEKAFLEIQRAKKRCRETLSANLACLLDNPEDTGADITIVSKDGEEFKVHKPILCARIEAFKKMLTCGLKECQISIIPLDDLSSKAIKWMLHFIYASDIRPYVVNVEDEERPCISELIYAADKYMIQDLLEHFNENIGNLCHAENVAFLLSLANKFSLTKAQADIKTCAKKDEAVFDKMFQSFRIN